MTDERLQELMDEARDSYRVPAEPPLDAMWARIEREHFDAIPSRDVSRATSRSRGRPRRDWWRPLLGIAATLVIGIGIGRVTAAPDAPDVPLVAVATPPGANPLGRSTHEYLDETVTLLASLARGAERGDSLFISRASQLLGTTRLLLDAPSTNDPRMRALLEDLELVLAQVARLRPVPRAEELTFIVDALDERDVVPRLRTVAAALSTSDYP